MPPLPPSTEPTGHLLVVDDSPDQLRLWVTTLSAAGHRVRPADSAELALAAISRDPPELVLLDLRLADQSGFAVCDRLKSDEALRDIPVLFISGVSDLNERLAGFQRGAVDFIVKPVNSEELLARVHTHLELARLRRRLSEQAVALQEAAHQLELEVAERRRAQAELEEKASRLTLATQAGGIGIWDWDLRNHRLFWDETLHLLCGLPPQAGVEPASIWETVIHPADRARCQEELRSALAHLCDLDTEFRILRADGVVRHLRFRARVQRDDTGQAVRILGISWDITEQKRTVERLQLFSRAVEQSPASVVITNTHGEIEYVNEKFTDVTGYAASEVLGRNPRVLKSGRTSPDEYRQLWHTIEAGEVWKGEFHNKNKQGQTYLESATITPIRGEAGRITHYLASKEDITARRAAEADLRHERWLLTCLMDTVPIFIFFKDADGRFLRINQAMSALLGAASPDAVTGRTDADFLDAGDARTTAADEQAILQTGRPLLEKTERLTFRTGQSRWFLTSKMPLRDASGVIIGTFGLASDITAQKQSEAERLALQVQLNQAQKLESIGRLAAGIAHEINTPSQFVSDNISYVSRSMADIERLLAAHGGIVAYLEKSGPLPPEVEALLQPIRKIKQARLRQEVPAALADASDGMGRITKIVRAMKSFSHPGGDEMTLTDLNQAIDSTLIVCRNEWKYIADLETDFAPDLPTVPCLRGDFNQVILNLVVNAAHAIADVVAQTPGTKGRITVSTRAEGDWVEVRISDTGTGIPESARPHLFEPFFTTKPVGKGTGQGLALARSVIVDRHKGSLTFETELGRGSTFILRLPLSSSHD
ncbi:MAG TPA: PAS domain S-box protein [Opitutaceae bacterium]|nr:PAS domain S-box protein [Opitutaceae bacterium]